MWEVRTYMEVKMLIPDEYVAVLGTPQPGQLRNGKGTDRIRGETVLPLRFHARSSQVRW